MMTDLYELVQKEAHARGSLYDGGREARAAKQTAGDFSFYHFQRLFATAENDYSWIQFYQPFLNTLFW